MAETLIWWPTRWRARVGEWFQRGELVDGRVVVETTMDPGERALILERAAKLRAERVLRDLEWGRLVATIPIEDYYRLLRERPGLAAGDKVEWAQFLTSEEAAPFLVTASASGRY